MNEHTLQQKKTVLKIIFILLTIVWYILASVNETFFIGIINDGDATSFNSTLLNATGFSLEINDLLCDLLIAFLLAVCVLGIVLVLENKIKASFILPFCLLFTMILNAFGKAHYLSYNQYPYDVTAIYFIDSSVVYILEWLIPVAITIILLFMAKINRTERGNIESSIAEQNRSIREVEDAQIEQLTACKMLLDEGVISREEFEKKKKEILESNR